LYLPASIHRNIKGYSRLIICVYAFLTAYYFYAVRLAQRFHYFVDGRAFRYQYVIQFHFFGFHVDMDIIDAL
jgi:hypothetical protein